MVAALVWLFALLRELYLGTPLMAVDANVSDPARRLGRDQGPSLARAIGP